MMDRCAFLTTLAGAAAASLAASHGIAATPATAKARNIVLVRGLFTDGLCWSATIACLRAGGSMPLKDASAKPRGYAISRATCRKRRQRFSMLFSNRFKRPCWREERRTRPAGRSRASMPFRQKTGQPIRTLSASWPSAWVRRPPETNEAAGQPA
jgi:hypothetical protein